MQALNHHIAKDGFRLRGTQASRIDGFSDVVFGFALTLIVVSLDVPKTFSDLHNLLRGFLPFAVTFLMLMLVWFTHYKFFRRYGTHDIGTIWLNGLLLFCVLFYVYPLKFMFAAFLGTGVVIDTPGQVRELTLLYAVGFTAIYLIFSGMYGNAWRQRDRLELTPLERRLTIIYFWEELGDALVGLIVILIALVLPPEKSTYATVAFMLITVHKTILGRKAGAASRLLQHAPIDSCQPDM